MKNPEPVHVAVAVIFDHHGKILITKRPNSVHQGGLWEFPGGKVEAGEDIETALAREITEELGIRIVSSTALISIPFDYGDKLVCLHVRRVSEFSGQPYGCEGQAMQWMELAQHHQYDFPEANQYILAALQLPLYYHITPEPDPDINVYLSQLKTVIDRQAELIQFRAKHMLPDQFNYYARESIKLCHQHKVKILLNGDMQAALDLGADGVHINSRILMSCKRRPVAKDVLLAASCHNLAELTQAQNIEVNFVVLGSIKATASHPGADIMGWQRCKELLGQVRVPAYALGGLSPADMSLAHRSGAQGIAAIRSLWVECR